MYFSVMICGNVTGPVTGAMSRSVLSPLAREEASIVRHAMHPTTTWRAASVEGSGAAQPAPPAPKASTCAVDAGAAAGLA